MTKKDLVKEIILLPDDMRVMTGDMIMAELFEVKITELHREEDNGDTTKEDCIILNFKLNRQK